VRNTASLGLAIVVTVGAHAVVGGPAGRVHQHAGRDVDLRHAALGAAHVVRVQVGVTDGREPAMGSANLLRGGVAGDLQDRVQVDVHERPIEPHAHLPADEGG